MAWRRAAHRFASASSRRSSLSLSVGTATKMPSAEPATVDVPCTTNAKPRACRLAAIADTLRVHRRAASSPHPQTDPVANPDNWYNWNAVRVDARPGRVDRLEPQCPSGIYIPPAGFVGRDRVEDREREVGRGHGGDERADAVPGAEPRAQVSRLRGRLLEAADAKRRDGEPELVAVEPAKRLGGDLLTS
jgi:hypothetical protein